MNAPKLNTPAVLIDTMPNEKEAVFLSVGCNGAAPYRKLDTPDANSDPIEPPIRLPQDWSNKRKWLIVTAISCVSFIV